VFYDSGDIAQYDEPYLYRRITNRLRGENYSIANMYKSRILEDIQSRYPMVTDIGIEYVSSNTVSVKLTFRPIDMIIRNQDKLFALVNDTILPIYS
jgi:hypothetical protein